MGEYGRYLAEWLFYYFMFGMALHVVDRYLGVPFYRWWYNRSRETPMPSDVSMGFMYERSFSRRHNWALVISALQSTYTFFMGGAINPFFEIIVLVLEAEVLLVGFWIGKYLFMILKRQKEIAEAVDRVGTTIEGTDYAGLAQKHVVEPLTSAVEFGKRVASRSTPPSEQPPASPPPVAPEPQKPDWRERLANYKRER